MSWSPFLGGPVYDSAPSGSAVTVNNQAPAAQAGAQASSYIDKVLGNAADNSAWSAQQASDLRQWQEQQNQKAMNFSAAEAAKNRDWQQYMSNTAHQREVADLKAAGLNPILSAMGGNGAAVTSGATASGVTSGGAKGEADTSANAAIAGLLGSFLNAQTQLQAMNTSAITNLAVADKYTAMEKYTSELSSQTQLTTANINAAASRYAADTHAEASKVAASISAAAMKYGYDVNSMTQQQIASFNASVNKDLAQMGYQHDFDIKTAFPSNGPGIVSSILGQLTGDEGMSSAVSAGRGLLDTILNGSGFGSRGLLGNSGGRGSGKMFRGSN